MLWVQPGTFTMGSPVTRTDETEHNVTLTEGFYLGKYEVTQAQYEAVMTGNPDFQPHPEPVWRQPEPPGGKGFSPSKIPRPSKCPRGGQPALPPPMGIRLPGGRRRIRGVRRRLNANYNWDGGATTGNDFKQTRGVGQYAANPWGFFDMHGSVWEWTADWYGCILLRPK